MFLEDSLSTRRSAKRVESFRLACSEQPHAVGTMSPHSKDPVIEAGTATHRRLCVPGLGSKLGLLESTPVS